MSEHPSLGRLREAFRQTGPGTSLPGAEVLEAIQRALAGRLPRRELLALAGRAASEPGLALAWQLAMALKRELAPVPAEARRRRFPLRGALAAVALAASVLAVVWLGPASRTVHRGRPHTVVTTTLADGAALPRERFELVWTAPLPQARYDVEVLDESLRVLYRAQGIRENRVLVPAQALKGVAKGGTVLWLVEALAPDGRTLRSPTFVQRVE